MAERNGAKGFSGIIGHADIVAHMQNTLRTRNVSHAYLLSGEKGSGKRLLASTFAMALQCEKQGTDPCLTCPSCKKALAGSHPDIRYLTHEKVGSISVDEVREQLVNEAAIRPYQGPWKIYVVEEAAKMTPQAQNALLKTLEEPPVYVVILLLADNSEALLPTILSRCVTLRLSPVADTEVKRYLMNQMHVPDYQADIETSFAQGNIGRARMIAQSSAFLEMTENAIQQMKRIKEMEVIDMVEAIKGLAEDKQNVYDYLDIYTLWFRDVLLYKATREVDDLLFKEEWSAIRERASQSSYEGLETILEAIRAAESRLRANVNFDLTMELLFLTIKEN